jgi:type II secretory pathway predicted ATPase ExeA
MYERFYGLRELPFDLTPNPRYLLLTDAQREALGNLEFGITRRAGVTVLIGEAGTGKTTLVRAAMAQVDASSNGNATAWAYLKNPTLSQTDFLRFLASSFGLPVDAEVSKTRLLADLERMLVGGKRAAVIVDEAQSLPHHLLEEIRLLANIESDTEKLLPVLLVGQPELAARLNEPALRQLKQRVALRCTLGPLTLHESGAYIAGRIEIAGGNPRALFSRDAVVAIHEASGGIPRTISVICANALLTGYADEQRPINRRIIETVCRDFDLSLDPASATVDSGHELDDAHDKAGAGVNARQTLFGRLRGRSPVRRVP